jgi:hypothetical protein
MSNNKKFTASINLLTIMLLFFCMNQISTLENYDEMVNQAFEEAHLEVIEEFKSLHRQLRSTDSLLNKGNMLKLGATLKGNLQKV